ncbi:MAG: outer membrane beta-barrel protein [candidate division Zixibacteria bacterium]|nr:outer membrane beta-barrel protein [candidate division Zixibacteria bacterium]
MKNLLAILTVLTLVLASSSFGFDGHRRGFVLGGGLGFSPVASWEVDGTTIDESGAGIGLNLLIGYAWDDQNMIVYEGNIAGWKSDFFLDRQVSQGFNGASWYHYFGETGRTAFTTLGIGYYVFGVEDFDNNDLGLGILAGAGYEFAKHWQIGAYYSLGKTSDSFFDYNHYHFNFLVGGIFF